MSETIKFLVWMQIGVVIGALLILLATTLRSKGGVWIPCDIAEISPDVPVGAKEECRRRRRKL